MNLLKNFEAYTGANQLFAAGDHLLLAVSGGVDSVVLCELCRLAEHDFSILHCNFQLRGEESERDERFVESLAAGYGVPFLVKRFDTIAYAAERKESIQVAARELRYAWFSSLLEEKNDDKRKQWVLTAHHLDDSIETSMMNYFKGTGISGLRGILPRQDRLIRPLLFARKSELLSFATERRLDWVEDSSNAGTKYARNYFRHQVIPLVTGIYPEAEANLVDNLSRFRDTELLYQQAIAWHKKRLMEVKGNEIHLPVLKLKQSSPLHSIVYEIIKEYQFTPRQVPEVLDLLESGSGKYVQSPTHRIIRNRKWLIIAPAATAEATTILIEGEGRYPFPFGELELSALPVKASQHVPPIENRMVELDHATLKFPFLLRPWKPGDYFYPLGMIKKKKLARFLIDQKVSKTEKERVWVIEMDKKIIWVVGMRIDERFKTGAGTKEIIRIHWSGKE